jgi:hypothetical protein
VVKGCEGIEWCCSAGCRAKLAGDAGPLAGVRERLGQVDHDTAHRFLNASGEFE